jgi:predicted ATPase/class 3 adenylate cyclase
METTNSFGYWIHSQRKALDLTQQALADRVGCSLAAVKKIESDERRPSRQIAERLAEVLGVQAGQREIFLEVARGLRSVDQLLLAHEPAVPTSTPDSPRPTGTVTFLYTDIEGSTQLWREHPKAMAVAQARHDQILREALESNNGYVYQVIGDGFCAAFHTAGGGLRAALESQIGLRNEKWGDAVIKVRMGIHTGKAEVQADGLYSGYITLSHVQRLMSAAHGGQVLVSLTTQELVQDELPEGVELRDMGKHRLKDFDRAEHIFQLLAPDLPTDFPSLKALETVPNNLPAQLTSFVGRQREIGEVKQLLSNTRLLTLTGPGGTGKTRLALQLAADALETFTEGVWLVELAPLYDPTLITQTVASTLGVREQPRRTILDALMDYLRAKQLLLILDNCEHLIETCAQITDSLLRAAPHLKILVTSREALGIGGETAYRVPSLPLPDPRQLYDLNALAQNDCVHLFVDRAIAAYPSFRLKEKNAPAIADICRRLDGIPLAIELASARTKVFPPEEIAARLDDRFRLLTGGSRTALERHQTLFALIEWSHNLLSESERVLLRRLSVFAGGWTFEAAQEVCGHGLGTDVLDLLTHLVDKSLVAVEAEKEAARYRLPETIRQYARDRLFESAESEQMRDSHLDFFIRFAEHAERKLRSAEQIEWLKRVETEHDNLRTALAWSLESGKSGPALQLAGAVSYFWVLRGYFSEGQKWLNDALAFSEREQSKKEAAGKYIPTHIEKAQRAKALYAAALPNFAAMNPQSARTLVEESLRLWRDLGDKWWTAVALELEALMMTFERDYQTALARLEEGVLLAREIEDPWPLAVCLIRFGDALKPMGEVAAAHPFLEEGVALARRVGDKIVLSEGLRELGGVYYAEGNLTAAASLTAEALADGRATGSIVHIFLALIQLVIISCLQNNPAKAKGYSSELWALGKETGSPFAAAFALLTFGLTASFGGEPGKGVRLLVATDVLLRQHGIEFSSAEGEPSIKVYKQALEKAQVQLGPEAFQAAWTEGQQMTLEQAIALATENESEASQPRNTAS